MLTFQNFCQLESQGDADAGLKVPHLDEYNSKTAGAGGGGGEVAVRLERSLLLDKLKGLEERVGRFEGLLACDSFFDQTDIDQLVNDYVMEGRCVPSCPYMCLYMCPYMCLCLCDGRQVRVAMSLYMRECVLFYDRMCSLKEGRCVSSCHKGTYKGHIRGHMSLSRVRISSKS